MAYYFDENYFIGIHLHMLSNSNSGLVSRFFLNSFMKNYRFLNEFLSIKLCTVVTFFLHRDSSKNKNFRIFKLGDYFAIQLNFRLI